MNDTPSTNCEADRLKIALELERLQAKRNQEETGTANSNVHELHPAPQELPLTHVKLECAIMHAVSSARCDGVAEEDIADILAQVALFIDENAGSMLV